PGSRRAASCAKTPPRANTSSSVATSAWRASYARGPPPEPPPSWTIARCGRSPTRCDGSRISVARRRSLLDQQGADVLQRRAPPVGVQAPPQPDQARFVRGELQRRLARHHVGGDGRRVCLPARGRARRALRGAGLADGLLG